MSVLLESSVALLVAQILFNIPAQLVVVLASVRLLHFEKVGRFVGLVMTLFVLNAIMGLYVAPIVNIIIGVGILVIPQFAFASDGAVRKLFIIIAIQLAILLAEIPPSIYWLNITEIRPSTVQAILLHGDHLLLAHAIHVGVLILLCLGIEVAEHRIVKNRTDEGILLFIWFLVLQYAMIGLGIFAMEMTKQFSELAALGLALVTIICIIADILCFYLLDRFNRTMRAHQQAKILQKELDYYLSHYEEVEREISFMARVRHDMRNQANVLLFLLERNEIAEARDYLVSLAKRVEGEAYE